MSTTSGGAKSLFRVGLRDNTGKSKFGQWVDNGVANFLDNYVDPVISSAKNLNDSIMNRVRDSVDPSADFSTPRSTLKSAVELYNDKFLHPLGDKADSVIDDAVNLIDDLGLSSTYSEVQPADNSGRSIDYVNADLAKHYGMDANAAYGEALQNTAYQRAVADLKAAGLNPVLAAGSVSPAGSYVTGSTLSGGSGAGASGAGGYGSSGKLLSGDAYNLLGTVGAVVGGVIGYAAAPAPWKIMSAATASTLGKNMLQTLAQGAGSAKNILGK